MNTSHSKTESVASKGRATKSFSCASSSISARMRRKDLALDDLRVARAFWIVRGGLALMGSLRVWFDDALELQQQPIHHVK